MQQLLKRSAWLVVLAMSARISYGFALIGPLNEAYQVPVIGYGIPQTVFVEPGGPVSLQDSSGPKNIGQEYRRTMPILYFSFDDNFKGFFGTQGTNAVCQAFQVYNDLTNVSMYSPDLSEFPFEVQEINHTAFEMSLTDVKSTTMHLIAEQIGLSQPERYTWTLHDRVHFSPGPACPLNMGYLVIQRNYGIIPSDLDQLQYSSYVNSTLYTYEIVEACTGPNPLALAVPLAVDPDAHIYTSVAADAPAGLQIGGFYTGLTRDDVGGIRYLIRANNVNFEDAGPGTVAFVTNSLPALITNQDLSLFAAQAATNDPATLVALYPGLVITSTNEGFGHTVTTNITEVLTNSPFDPAGFPPTHPLFSTNYTTNFTIFFQYTFGNLFTNTFSTRGLVGSVSLGLTNSPFSPAGTPPTIITNTKMTFVNGVFGSFYLLPTNFCAVQVLSNVFSQLIATTNFPATNVLAGTAAATNAITFTPGTISFFTNQILVYLPVNCPTNPIETREGLEKISFVPRAYDSTLGQFYVPATNDYTLMVSIFTNNVTIEVPEHIRRVVTRPDFLFTAADLADGPGGINFVGKVDRAFNFNQTVNANGAAGPGTIEPQTVFTFNEVGTLFWNGSVYAPLLPNAGLGIEGNQTNAIQALQWASFDGTTNPPILYPNGTVITVVNITTTTLPDATVGSAYSAQLAATGGQPPYTWSLSPASPALPTGLSLSTNGIVSGTPTGPAAFYDFSVRATDSVGQFVDAGVFINVNP